MSDELLVKLTQELLHYEPPERKRSGYIHISEIKECIRKTYYIINNTAPDPDKIQTLERAKFTMAFGNLWESYICSLLTSLKIPWHKQRVANEALKLHGETDPIIEYHGKIIILEAKSVHQRQFEYLYDIAKKNISIENYYSQLQGYLHLYLKADYGAFIIGNRNQNPKDKGPPFFLQEIQRDDYWKHINFEEPDGRIPKLNLALDTNEIPDREFEKDSYPCSYCQFHKRCWEKDK